MKGRSAIVRATDIRLKRQLHNGCFLVVEGRDDRLFFEQFAERRDCRITTANGKENVADVVSILEADRFPGVVGVVDADFDHIEGRDSSSDNLIVLETVDLEALLVRSSALDRVLVELGSATKIAGFGMGVREALAEAAATIGCLRLYSLRSGLRLRFQGLRYGRFVDKWSLTIDIHALIREVMDRSQRSDLLFEDVSQQIASLRSSVDDRWLVCCGADMVEILALGLRSALGTNNARDVEPTVVRKCLRLAFQAIDLESSRLGRDLREWEVRNSEFRVLRPD